MSTFTPEEIAERRQWIGGSEAAAAIGLNPYESQFDVWQRKMGLAPEFVGNEATKWGKLHEPAIRQEYAQRMGRVVRLPPDTIVSEAHPFMACHPDGVTDDRRLFEAKTARFADNWGEDGSDDIPEAYMVQVQHNMLVLGLDVCDLAALIHGSELRIYEIPAHREMQANIIELERQFWHYVETATAPPPDFDRKDAVAVLRKMYPGTTGEILVADQEAQSLRSAIEQYAKVEKDAAAAKEGYRAKLLNVMKDATFLQFPDGKQYRRAQVNRKGYSVEPATFMDLRLVAVK